MYDRYIGRDRSLVKSVKKNRSIWYVTRYLVLAAAFLHNTMLPWNGDPGFRKVSQHV